MLMTTSANETAFGAPPKGSCRQHVTERFCGRNVWAVRRDGRARPADATRLVSGELVGADSRVRDERARGRIGGVLRDNVAIIRRRTNCDYDASEQASGPQPADGAPNQDGVDVARSAVS